LSTKVSTPEAYRLIHDGAVALAGVEANGIQIDVQYLDGAIADVGARIQRLEGQFRDHAYWTEWKKLYGTNANLGSREQLGKLLFSHMGLANERTTASGKLAVDAVALEQCQHPFARNYIKLENLKKLQSTYLLGVRREVAPSGLLHVFYNLHRTLTYRSSSEAPNFQNIPIRDPEMAKWIRRAFVPRCNRQLLELDFKGIEVGVAACYNLDPQLISYVKDKSTDMHRDTAAELFMLPETAIPKNVRQAVKGSFVFAQFYGDWYVACTKSLWADIEKLGLKTADGVCLYEHLARHGVRERGECRDSTTATGGTFEAHVKSVEKKFWKKRFKVYDRWREQFYSDYLKNGGFATHTGFYITGLYGRNNVTNYPIQGSAFHCLLWCLIRLGRQLRQRRMQSLIVGQIHDSMVLDVVPAELDEVVGMVQEIVRSLLKEWRWIIVPLEIEMELAPVGGSWFDKKEFKI